MYKEQYGEYAYLCYNEKGLKWPEWFLISSDSKYIQF